MNILKGILALLAVLGLAFGVTTLPVSNGLNAQGYGMINEGAIRAGIAAVEEGANGTVVLNLKDLYLFGWKLGDTYAFVCTSSGVGCNAIEAIGSKGTFTTPEAFTALKTALIDVGWKVIAVSQVPAAIFRSFNSTSVFFVVPAEIYDEQPFQ